jgi:RNA-directed DNA polymerase
VRLTPRTSGQSLEHIIEQLNPVIRGWYEYFKHAHWNVFKTLDGRIRKRLRAIKRKRNKISGHTNRADHERWPNAYFIARGLFTMDEVRQR